MENRYVCRVGSTERIIAFRIKPESDLLKTIQKIAEEKNVKSGVIISGVGLLKQVRLRNCKTLPKEYPITDANRYFITLNKPSEILVLSGNISEVDGKALIHAHITLSSVEGDEVKFFGGHLTEGCIVFGQAEIFVMELKNIDMCKKFDQETKTVQLFM